MTTINNTNTNTNNTNKLYSITYQVSAWTSERQISPEEMESLKSSGVPTPVLNALKDKGVSGKGRIKTYDPELLKPFDAIRGKIKDKFRDLNAFPFIGGAYIFADEAKYKEALAFVQGLEAEYWNLVKNFMANFDVGLENYISRNKAHEAIIRSKLIDKEKIKRKFEYDFISYEDPIPAQGADSLFRLTLKSFKDYVSKKAEGSKANKKAGIKGSRAFSTLINNIIKVAKDFRFISTTKIDNLINYLNNLLVDVDQKSLTDMQNICNLLADVDNITAIMDGSQIETSEAEAEEAEAEADETSESEETETDETSEEAEVEAEEAEAETTPTWGNSMWG